MKKLYHEYFHIPENGKISDKVMLGRTVVAALCVILCLCAFSVSTYAYYYMTVVSSGNTVQAATFEAEVHVFEGNEEVDAIGGVYPLDANSEYTVVVIPRGSAKGFAVVTVASQAGNQALMLASVDEGEGEGSGEEQAAIPEIDISGAGTYYTPQLFEDGQAKAATFTIQTTEAVTMSIEAHWGKKQDSLEATPITVDLSSIDSALLLLEEEEEEELEPATNTDLQGNFSGDPVEPDTPIDSNESTNPSNPVVPDTPTTDEGNAEGEGESAGGDEDTGSDQSTGEGENTGGEEGAADDAVTDEGDAADENNTVSGDDTTGAEVA